MVRVEAAAPVHADGVDPVPDLVCPPLPGRAPRPRAHSQDRPGDPLLEPRVDDRPVAARARDAAPDPLHGQGRVLPDEAAAAGDGGLRHLPGRARHRRPQRRGTRASSCLRRARRSASSPREPACRTGGGRGCAAPRSSPSRAARRSSPSASSAASGRSGPASSSSACRASGSSSASRSPSRRRGRPWPPPSRSPSRSSVRWTSCARRTGRPSTPGTRTSPPARGRSRRRRCRRDSPAARAAGRRTAPARSRGTAAGSPAPARRGGAASATDRAVSSRP